jgi:hypothetical protein
MAEIALISTPGVIRTFFARILAHCSPANPLDLWNRFKHDNSEDFCRNHIEEISYNLALRDIAEK